MSLDRFEHELQRRVQEGDNVRVESVGPQPGANERLRTKYLAWLRELERWLREAVEPPPDTTALFTPRFISILQDQIPVQELSGVINAELDHQIQSLHNLLQQVQEKRVLPVSLEDLITRLMALRESIGARLANPRARYFDPLVTIDLFDRYATVRDQLRSEYPDLYGDLPVRRRPQPSGTTDFEGRGYIQRAEVELLLNDADYCLNLQPAQTRPASDLAADPKAVWVVHGRDLRTRDAMFAFLRALELHPIEFSQARAETGVPMPYVGEVLDAAFARAQAVVVLLTPDDEAQLREEFRRAGDPAFDVELTPQSRPNVIFEAGMAMGRHAERTVLIELAGAPVRPFSDVAGRHILRLDNTVSKRQELAQRLRDAGCDVEMSGTDWHSAGEFP